MPPTNVPAAAAVAVLGLATIAGVVIAQNSDSDRTRPQPATEPVTGPAPTSTSHSPAPIPTYNELKPNKADVKGTVAPEARPSTEARGDLSCHMAMGVGRPELSDEAVDAICGPLNVSPYTPAPRPANPALPPPKTYSCDMVTVFPTDGSPPRYERVCGWR